MSPRPRPSIGARAIPPSSTDLTPEARLDAVLQALDASALDRAVVLADAALQAGVEHPLFLNLVAFDMERRGRIDVAATLLRRALDLAPDDVLILTALGRVFSQLGRGAEALALFDQALSVHPDHAPAHHEQGLALSLSGEEAAARAAHARAAALDPHYPGPLGALADLALRDNDQARARDFAARALALDPSEPSAGMVMAYLSSRAGDHAAAAARAEGLLKTALTPLHRSAVEQLLGEELDNLGEAEAGMAAIVRSNRILRDIYGPIYDRPDLETGTALCRRLQAYFAAADPADWAPAPGVDPAPVKGHVFLVGFVRSGTTLLEQVLASHPDVAALEEQATLRALAADFFDTDAGLARLAALGEAEADALRADYWRRVRGFGVDPDGRVFVDKAPLSTLWLPMIAKLFPTAKVLLAIRDPRDVVISAFRHRFFVNALAWPFTDLVDAAEFYAGVMGLGVLYQEKLSLDLYTHRHEDLVDDFDGEAGRIAAFLGLAWSDQFRDFAETAKRRDVRTPSAEQVRGGLTRAGVGRWRRYGAVVDPILPILGPWVERFGYPD